MKKRVFIYIRVSTKEQAEEGYSIGEQEERLIKYCEAMEWEVVKVFIDAGFSGANMDRPNLQAMIKEIEKGNAEIVLVDKLDRLSRSQFDTLYLIKKVFNEHNVAFVSRAESFDTATPFGRAMVGILAVFAELERERIKERMMDGLEGRAKEGKFKGGGQVPIGYDYDQASGKLIINEYEAMMVREAFEMFINRMPIRTIANTMIAKGYKTKYGSGKWSDLTLRRMFENQNYIGKIKHHEFWYEGMHDAIISDEVFEKAQQILAERSRENEKFKVGKRYKSPLGGIMWCGCCGAKYQWRHNGRNKDGSFRSYYICYSRSKADKNMIKDPNCKNPTYRDFVLEEIIYNEIRKLKTEPDYFKRIRTSVDTTANQKVLQDRIKQLDGQISKLMDLYSLDHIDINVVNSKMKPLNEEKQKLTVQLEVLQEEQKAVSEEYVLEFVDLFEEAIKEDDKYKINRIVNELIDHIILDGEDIQIHWNF